MRTSWGNRSGFTNPCRVSPRAQHRPDFPTRPNRRTFGPSVFPFCKQASRESSESLGSVPSFPQQNFWRCSLLNTVPCGPRAVLPLLQEMYELKKPVFLWGKPGIGKSDVVRDFATQNDMRLIDLRLTTLESVDLRGLPWIDGERRQTAWMRPEFFPVDDKPTVIFLDELTAAEPRIQASSYQLILDRCIGSHVLPPSAWVIGAGNGLDDGSISYGMGAALADRFLHVNMIASSQDWVAWALDHGVHPSVITFIRLKPECLDSSQGLASSEQLVSPSPRSWECVSRILKQVKNQSVRSLAINGLVGESVAVQFLHTMEEIGQVPPIDALLEMTPGQAAHSIPASLGALYGFTYSAVAYVEKLNHMEWLIFVLDAIARIRDTHPRAEIQSLGMELLLEKASRLRLMDQLVRSAAYTSAYKRKAGQLST